MTTTVGSGLGGSIGFASETIYGTYVAPSRYLEFESETLAWKPKRVVGKGLASGRTMQRNTQRSQLNSTVDGDIKTGVYYNYMGLLFGSLMGSMTTTPVQQGSTAAYLQTHALASQLNQSLTIQVGKPDISTATVHPYNYRGLKVSKGVIECGLDEYLTQTLTFDGQQYDTTNSFSAPSYLATNTLFSFAQGVFRIGTYGSEVLTEGIRKFTLNLDRPMRADMFFLDGTGLKQQPVQNNFTMLTVDLEYDYWVDSGMIADFFADTARSLIIDFIGPQIAVGAGGAKTITAVSAAAGGGVVTAASHGYSNGQTVIIAGVTGTGMPSPSINGTWVVNNVTTNTFTIGLNTTGFSYTSGGTAQLTYNNQISFQIPNLRWDGDDPGIAGPDVIQPKLKLVGLDDGTHTPMTISYMSSDTAL